VEQRNLPQLSCVSADQTALARRTIGIPATASRWFEFGLPAALLSAAAVSGYELVASFPTSLLIWLFTIALTALVADYFLTCGMALDGRSTTELVVSAEGVTGLFRPAESYRRAGTGFSLRTVLLRLPMRGFDGPNFIRWSDRIIVSVSATSKAGFVAQARVSFRGIGDWGPQLTLGRLRMWLSADTAVQLIEAILRHEGHVHIEPKLVPDWRGPWRRCPLEPSRDPRHGGICLPASGPSLFGRHSSGETGSRGAWQSESGVPAR